MSTVGDIMSTFLGVQYTGGGIMSTQGDIMMISVGKGHWENN